MSPARKLHSHNFLDSFLIQSDILVAKSALQIALGMSKYGLGRGKWVWQGEGVELP